MPKRHNIFQENANPCGESIFASSELPKEGSIFARRGYLGPKASRSAPCLRVFLAALASVAAIAVLIFACSRAYRKRAVQGLRSRRLAEAEDSDASIDVCGISSDEGEQDENASSHSGDSRAGDERELPLKKRLLARVAEGGIGGEARSPQQQEQPQQQYETAASPFRLSPPRGSPTSEQFLPSAPPVHSPLQPAEMQMPIQLNGATELLDLHPIQHGDGGFASGSRRSAFVPYRRRQPQSEGVHQWYDYQLQHQLFFQQAQPGLQQQPQQHFHYWQHLYWDQGAWHQQQQMLLQEEAQSRLFPQEEPLPAMQYQQQWQQPSIQHQEQQVTSEEEREQQHKALEGRRKRKHEEELELPESRQHRPFHDGGPPRGYLPEEWIDLGSTRPDMPHLNALRRALQVSPPAAAAGASTSKGSSLQTIAGLPVAAPAAAPDAAGELKDEAFSGVAAGSGAAQREWPYADGSSAASMRSGEGRSTDMPLLTALLTRGPADDARGAREEAGSAVSGALSNSEGPQMHDTVHPDISEHPFVRLPRLAEGTGPPAFWVDFWRAVIRRSGMLYPVVALQKAHELLSRERLGAGEVEELAQLAGILIAHGIHHQRYDLSNAKPAYAVTRLGLRFLVLDAVVSILTVLGQIPENAYWQPFTNAISHTAPVPAHRRTFVGREHFASYRCQELSWAIQVLKMGKRPDPEDLLRIKRMLFCLPILKMGKRPDPEDLLRIKRMLFCLPNSPKYFKGRDFDPWRMDDLRFTKGS
ncbi:hypothetical protein EPH_0055890 [Eimeria praecox]|uniref:Uncharacterized protein n=1 Tax=Eimeria praecox TaxID=51316 RepID=U6GS98_9EIME|nr:hypothetical protein EPH_0055890 [Eimeria praecox]